MTLDPDLWLFGRLAVGATRRQRTGAAALAILVASLVAAATVRRFPEPLLLMAVTAVGFSTVRAVGLLIVLERDGRLDAIRMSGRSPVRLFVMAWTACAAPFLVIGLVALGACLFTGGITALGTPFDHVMLWAFVFLLGTGASLIYFEAPALLGSLVAGGIVLILLIVRNGVDVETTLLPLAVLVSGLLVIAALPPLGARMARPRQAALPQAGRRLVRALSASIPRKLPPELYRSAITTLRSRDGSGLTILTALAILLPAPLVVTTGVGTLLVIYAAMIALGLAGFLTASLVRSEMTSGSAALVRLTPQAPAAVILGWLLGPSAALYLAVMTALALLPRDVSELARVPLPVPVLAGMFATPAIGVLQAVQGRRGIHLITTVVGSTLVFAVVQRPGMDTLAAARMFTAAAAISVIALAASVGRFRRLEGPALGGPAAVLTVAATGLVVVLLRFDARGVDDLSLVVRLSLGLFTGAISLPAAIALFIAPLITIERSEMTTLLPRMRVLIVAAATAGAIVALLTSGTAIETMRSAILATGALVASAAIHELCWPAMTLSLAVRSLLVILLATTARSPIVSMAASIGLATAVASLHRVRVGRERRAS